MSLDPLKLLRETQAQNRAKYAADQARRDKVARQRTGPHQYLGVDADQGRAIVYRAGDPNAALPGHLATTGSIQPGQGVNVGIGGGLVTVTQKPRVRKPEPPPPEVTEPGQVKVLFLVNIVEDGQTIPVLYIGGDRQTPTEIYRLPVGANSITGYVNNLGNAPTDWIVSVSYRLGFDAYPTLATISSGGGEWISTPTDRRSAPRRANGGEDRLTYMGFGLWVGGGNDAAGLFDPLPIFYSFYWLRDDYAELEYANPATGATGSMWISYQVSRSTRNIGNAGGEFEAFDFYFPFATNGTYQQSLGLWLHAQDSPIEYRQTLFGVEESQDQVLLSTSFFPLIDTDLTVDNWQGSTIFKLLPPDNQLNFNDLRDKDITANGERRKFSTGQGIAAASTFKAAVRKLLDNAQILALSYYEPQQ